MTSAPPDPTPDETLPETPATPETPEPPLLTLRDGLPPIVETPEGLAEVCERIAAGTGPVAVDAERASGYRYSSRAYLIQLRREGSGTFLVDPIPFVILPQLQDALEGTEWILHAATQDLPCLAEVGLVPTRLFDTELAGRLLGYPRVGLATLVESLLGARLAKEHSAVDWSTRPLPEPWLEYAALDVEVLVELRALIEAELEAAGKAEWARQEFDALRSFVQPERVDAWRRTSGLHRVRGRRALGAVRALWEARDEIAEQRDVTPGRILPDSAIIAAATALPTDRAALLATKGFHGRGADRYASRWVAALRDSLQAKRDRLGSALDELGFEVHDSFGTYFLCADPRPLGFDDSTAFCAQLPEKTGVAAIPMAAFCDPQSAHAAAWNHLVRFAFCKRDVTLDEAIRRLGVLKPHSS